MIKVEEIYDATNGGLDVLCHFYSEINRANPKKPLKLRPDDKRPSAGIFQKKGIWYLKDHGGTDQKAYNAVELVKEKLNLSFAEAIKWIATNFAPHLLASAASNNTVAFKATMKKVAPSSEMRIVKRKSGLFTDAELGVLGYNITQEMCNEFGLIPLDGYISKAKGDYSWSVEGNDQYPIMFYDYGQWGKIYQPYGDIRFLYYGEKPANFIFGTKEFQKKWAEANLPKPKYPWKPMDKNEPSDDYCFNPLTETDMKDERFPDLIICSGPSDALNVYGAGYQVCWLNSESEPISDNNLKKLKRLCRNLYILFDADATGIRNAQKIALQDLDIKIISLPDDLEKYTTNKRDSNGNTKPCKDIKDYMMFYKRGQINPRYEFKNRLVKLATQLKFWTEMISEKGKVSYDLSLVCLFKFLSVTGFFKMMIGPFYRYVYIQDKVVEVIPDSNIAGRVREHLLQFIKDNTRYYTEGLANMILRNKILSSDSFQNLETIELNFDSFSETEEYFFFKNMIVRVTADMIEKVDPRESTFHVLKEKVTDHNLLLTKPFFSVNTDWFDYASNLLTQYSPDSPDYYDIKQEIDKMTNSERFNLEILNGDFDFLKYVYNTGNKFWREEAEAKRKGSELSPTERKIVNLNFISKCSTLGYLLSKYRSPSSGKAVYCMEIAVDDLEEGQHNGGTGKSLFLDSLKYMRKRVFINGQNIDKKMEFLFQSVDIDSDIIHIDDLSSKVDLNRFLPSITNDLVVNRKGKDEFIIPMTKAPKFAFSSNHAISRFYGSLRRRIQFCGFTDYYHSANPETGLQENSPKIEFGRNLLFDYKEEDMNNFYNFMLQCVQLYLRYGLIETDMGDIEDRQKKNKVGLDFLDWADDYFENRFNTIINEDVAFEDFKKNALSKIGQGYMKKNTFTKKVITWCEIKGYEYNPKWYMNNRSETERKRNKIRYTDTFGNPCYGFYIYSKEEADNPS